MGNTLGATRTEEDFLHEFSEVKRESDAQFGSVIIYRSNKNSKLMLLVKEKIFTSSEELRAYVSKASTRASIKGINVSPLMETIVIEEKSLCSTSYKVLIGYEYHERTLEKLLRLRKNYDNEDAQIMTESDAWGILSDLARGLRSFQEKSISHGDIQPASIFVLNNKTLKLIDNCFMNEHKSAFNRRYYDFSYKSTFGPQAMSMLSLGPNHASFDKEKNDIWSIGICLLVSLTNEDFNIFYDWPNQEINMDIVQDRIRKVQNMGYTADLIKTLRMLLERDEFKRISLHDLLTIVGRYTRQSMNNVLNEYDREYDIASNSHQQSSRYINQNNLPYQSKENISGMDHKERSSHRYMKNIQNLKNDLHDDGPNIASRNQDFGRVPFKDLNSSARNNSGANPLANSPYFTKQASPLEQSARFSPMSMKQSGYQDRPFQINPTLLKYGQQPALIQQPNIFDPPQSSYQPNQQNYQNPLNWNY